MQVSTQGHTSCVHTTLLLLSPSQRGFACWVKLWSVKKQKKKKKKHPNISTIFLLRAPPAPAEGVSVTLTHHILNIHQCTILFPATNATGRQQGSFSVITQKSLPILEAPNLDASAIEDWRARLTLTFACITWMNKKGRWLEVKQALDLESLTVRLFQPHNTHTVLNRPV